jgi:phosphoglucomutase
MIFGMEHGLITSASGWRKVFAVSGDPEDTTSEIGMENTAIAALAAEAYAEYLSSIRPANQSIVLGIDSRPTGPAIADAMIRVFMAKRIAVTYTGISAAPEIMAMSRNFDGFVYVSASHNPVGHNGVKFGLNEGGVLCGSENAKIVKLFNGLCGQKDAMLHAAVLTESCPAVDLDWVYSESIAVKREAASVYRSFTKTVISGTDNINKQNKLFAEIRDSILSDPLGVVCDMNGSARSLSIDSTFLPECGITFYAIHNKPGEIVHTIIPEPENLVWCAHEMERLHAQGHKEVKLGYMPDCDGDRGNIVFWNNKTGKAEVLKAQEVFALSVMSELAYSLYMQNDPTPNGLAERCEHILKDKLLGPVPDFQFLPCCKTGVAVNDPTSMRIEEIAHAFKASVFRAEVGEANVVNLAREKRMQGYEVRILGEGSNGGNITHPSAVRDPINTLFALIKLLVLRDTELESRKKRKGLFHLWCSAAGCEALYKQDFTLSDVIATLPVYTTTGVSEKRAVLHINSKDHGQLKARFQKIFEKEWEKHHTDLYDKFGFVSYEAVCNNGTKETRNLSDFSQSGKGGLKIIFYGPPQAHSPELAFIWMRGSGTEPVFRVMCDVKGKKTEEEKWLLEWETQMIMKADSEQ